MSKRNNLRIPNSQIENFKFLLNLPVESKEEIVNIIKTAPVGTTEYGLFEILREKINNLSQTKIGDIYSIYLNLSNAKQELELDNEEFIEDLKLALNDSEEINLQDYNDEHFRIFYDIFDSKNKINISRKIESEYLLNDKNYVDLKVITDIRTVFENDQFIGSTIVNKLKIKYLQNDEEKNVYLSVDEHDIEKIIESLKVAQNNNLYLKNNIKDLEITSLLK